MCDEWGKLATKFWSLLSGLIRMQTQAQITYCGHSTVIVTTETGKRIIVDPWLEGNPRCPSSLQNPGKLDGIALTHGHSDHSASAVALAKENRCPVFATYELAVLLGREGVGQSQLQMMNKGGTVAVAGFKLTLTHAYHSSSYDASDGNTYYAGEACGVVITLESGRNIYHAGDTALFGDMVLIRSMFNPIVSLLPIGDRFTMGPKAAVEAVKLIRPKYAIPIHYGTFEALTGTAEEFASGAKAAGVEPMVLEPGEDFSF